MSTKISASETYKLCPFRIVVDTREQAPFTFRGFRADSKDGCKPLVIETVTSTLETGDYSIEGFEGRVSIERKSINDFYGTILGGRDRFERELERLQRIAEGVMRCDSCFTGPGCDCVDNTLVHSPGYAEIVCEGDWYTEFPMLRQGDAEQQRKLKIVYRSVIAWKHRYPLVRWERWPSRRDAERYVFRTLERFWNESHGKR